MEIAYFKRPQNEDFHYFKVFGGNGKTKNGYQEVINFLNEKPIISIEHNNTSELTGTWCTYEVGIPISKAEYESAFKRATENTFTIM